MRTVTATDLAGLRDPVVVFTFGRSGTHLTLDLLRRQFPVFATWRWFGRSNANLYASLDELALPDADVARTLANLARPARPLVKSHLWGEQKSRLARSQPALVDWLERRGRVLFVVREPYRAIASLFALDHLQREAETNLLHLPVEGYVAAHARRWVDQVESLHEQPPVLTLRYEDLLGSPQTALPRIARHIDEVPLGRQPLLPRDSQSRTRHRLVRLFALAPQSTKVVVSRRARARYRLEWTDDLVRLTDAIVRPTMDRLGYGSPLSMPLPDSAIVSAAPPASP